jgi:hypothetical protein
MLRANILKQWKHVVKLNNVLPSYIGYNFKIEILCK